MNICFTKIEMAIAEKLSIGRDISIDEDDLELMKNEKINNFTNI